MSGKRKRLNLKEKVEIILTCEKEKLSVRQAAEKFSISKTQIATILTEKREIIQNYEKNGNNETKRKFPRTELSVIDDTLFRWVCQMRAKNMPLSGPMLQAKALEVAKNLNVTTFTASNGWLQKFRTRHGKYYY